MNQADSFEIIEKGIIYLPIEPDQSKTKDSIKIVKLSSECLTEKHLLAKTSKTLKPLSIIKSSTHLVDSKILLWNQLKEMPETSKEQLNDLILLCDLKNKKNDLTHPILSFAFKLAKNHEKIGISEFRPIIGKLIYLVNQNIEEISFLIAHKKDNEQIKHINACFENEMKKINIKLIQFQESHKKGLLQDHEKALSVKIPVELAKALISDTGFVNIGIISLLMKRFLNTSKNRKPYEKNIAFVLSSIERSPSLRKKIHLIPEPFSQILPANDLIRITLELPADALTTSLDAKKTALAALLSHMRQSPASSCFASYLAIELLSKELPKCLDDFLEILHVNHLKRFVNGEEKEFSFLMSTGKESTSKLIRLDASGMIYSGKDLSCYIWEVPGIISACSSIGIKNPESKLLELSKEINKTSKTSEISISKILKLIAALAPGYFKYNYACAKLSFESQLHNPLLRMWENVMATMAEATGNGKISKKLIKSVTLSLEKAYPNNTFKQKMADNLKKSACYAYDNDIKSKNISNDGRSGRGAFILYHQNSSNLKPIENVDDFRQFVISIVKQVLREIKIKDKTILENIISYINKEEFIQDCLKFYDEANMQFSGKELVQNLKSLAHTPWIDKTGNNSNEVLRVYFGQVNQPLHTILNPKNAPRLFSNLIEIGRKFPLSYKQTLNQNPQILTPLIIRGVHAFSMMFGHETFIKAINSKKPAEEWILDNLINPGKKISDSKITKEGKAKLILLVAHNTILKQDKEGFAKFHDKANSLSEELSISAFREQLILIIKEIHNDNYRPMKVIIQKIDFFIFQFILSAESQNFLKETAVHFADTNWDVKLQDEHFCFIFNPGSAKIEMWEVCDDGSGLHPLSQQDWITNQTWEIYEP